MKCLIFICAASLVALATCAPGTEIREKQSATQDVTDKFEHVHAPRPRRQALDTVDIVYIDAAAINPSKVNLQNKEATYLQPVNDVTNLQNMYKFASASDSKLELVSQNSNFEVYKLKDGDEKTPQASNNQYFQYDNGQNFVENREPPPPPPDHHDPPPPPPPDHHHPPPPPPPHHHHRPPPPYGYPPPPHHHHHPPPPPPDDYRSNYYDQYNSYYDDYYNRPPPPQDGRRIYDDRQTRQSPNDRPYHRGPPPYRGGPPDRFYGRPPPHHGGPPDRFDGRPPHHGGPPDRFDRRPPHHGGPPDRFDRRPPPHHGGPPHNDPWSNRPRPPPPNDGEQPNDKENENYQNDSTTSTTTTTTVAPDDDDQYQLDVRFADDEKLPADETTKNVKNPKRGAVTTLPILSRLFQAAAVTPAD
ncbi:hypothetical protein SFRURICE_021575 [Spodoptera frugiperda]|nr:hypothetical protein SFRURICE_021575 [Spodoptera frugiperda]